MANTQVNVDGTVHGAGAKVELDDDQAARLVAAGLVTVVAKRTRSK